ncbi:hypothetical protein G7046_g8763 [Stylonectria norvegica]|nr:hypothetical protein G7046_g8763 [Stylonectria norvegica]
MVVLLYRVARNSWAEPDVRNIANLHAPVVKSEIRPVPPPQQQGDASQVDNLPVPLVPQLPQPPVVEKKLDPIVQETKSSKTAQQEKEKDTDGDAKVPGKASTLKDLMEDEEDYVPPRDTPKGKAAGSVDAVDKPARGPGGKTAKQTEVADDTVPVKVPAVADQNSAEAPDVQWKNPPKNANDPTPVKDTDRDKPEKHWKRPEEHFALPLVQIHPLPTGTPKKIPQIQYDFGTESDEAKTKRLQRQKTVKAELERAWGGYRKYAWMHDELSPLSNKYRDPFCGWAATLVDSLDTLWIAGMKEEFDEAAKAVKDIDFTYTPKNEIPVFETTIRYLGGLLAAYDLSGGDKGEYSILLEKAVELGEILMGIFDTPNRLPVLYYRWRPPYSSQPHRAGVVGIAELGTLSMEFTRLAQLTSENKYYDAVDRITDAMIDMQERGTIIPGLFPERVDASGCNKTATTIQQSLSKEAQKQIGSSELQDEPVGFAPEASKESPKAVASDDEVVTSLAIDSPKSKKGTSDDRLERRDVPTPTLPDGDGIDQVLSVDTSDTISSRWTPPLAADGSTAEWDCVPQGLVSTGYGRGSFHVGGAQDSAYEYFPKQYLLLGGLEPKYRKLHEDAIEAINEWLLYRPMIKDEDEKWDILFPARVSTAGNPDTDLTPFFEVTHLTCFVGGMFALGGKIFDREQDIETAKKLTDGCVWAYQSTTSGVMAETAQIMSCPTLNRCEFNQTLWFDHLDPSREWRRKELERWEEAEARLDALEEEVALEEAKANKLEEDETNDSLKRENLDLASDDLDKTTEAKARSSPTNVGGDEDGDVLSGGSSRLRKRAVIPVVELEKKLPAEDEDDAGSELPDSLRAKIDPSYEASKAAKKVAAAVDNSETESTKSWAQRVSNERAHKTGPPTIPKPRPGRTRTTKPLTHEEFVKEKLEKQKTPPGYTSVSNKSYILRPEAIESVWYMYRITGDPEWMDKGWRMFEATVQASRTEFANSAIDDVLSESPRLKDEMESFWIAETLKYYYLLFSEPDLVSLDEWVLNTEAHPFRRPT